MSNVDVASITATLNEKANELDELSKLLAQVERDLNDPRDPSTSVARRYEDHLADHDLGLWDAHVQDGAKFPPAEVRRRMALRDMDPVLRGRHEGLMAARKRLEQRIKDLGRSADAQRSVLSALKTELEATR